MENEKKPFDFYANNISINTSTFECVVEFGKEAINGSAADKEVGGVVRMSPQLLKVFGNILNDSIKQYEEINGVINLPSPTKGVE